MTCKEAIGLLSAQGFDTLPVISVDGQILGVVTEGNLTAKLVSNRVQPDDDITCALYTQFRKVRWFASFIHSLTIQASPQQGGRVPPPTD